MRGLIALFDPTSSPSGSFPVSYVNTCGNLHIKNASPVDVIFTVNGDQSRTYVVQAGEPRTIPVLLPKAVINWTSASTLQSSSKQLQSSVYVEAYESGDTIPTSLALPRHVNAEKLGFSGTATYSIPIGPIGPAALNIFNPGNSGVNGYFYQSRMISHQATPNFAVTPLFQHFVGPDINFGSAAIVTNDILGGPTSVFHVTGDNGNQTLAQTPTTIEQWNAQMDTPVDFLINPAQSVLSPGDNLLLQWPGVVAADLYSFACKWTENPVGLMVPNYGQKAQRLILYGSATPDATLPNACDMATQAGGAETSIATAFTGSSPWAEILSQGGTSASVATIPATPTGHGWTFRPQRSFLQDVWDAIISFADSTSPTGNLYFMLRFFRYTGSYAPFGQLIYYNPLAGGRNALQFQPAVFPAQVFNAPDILYIDLWYTGNQATIFVATSSSAGVVGDMQITTAAFSN